MSGRIDTLAVAKDLESIRFERLPALIIDECLDGCAKELSATADMVMAGKLILPHETLAMPKKRFGPRPITVNSAAARVAYLALVRHLGDALGPQSREDENWKAYDAFALDSESEYIVRFDIASYYEFIDHGILAEQVLKHTLDPDSVEKLELVLKSVVGGRRGLPQLLAASDHLADVYIGPLERRLIRDGYSVARYVDDFTVPCAGWEAANIVIEKAAEYARGLGLVLSSEKSSISKRATLIGAKEAEARFIDDFRTDAEVELSDVFLWRDYDEMLTEEEVDEDETMKAAMWDLLHQWLATVRKAEPEDSFHLEGHYRTYLPGALVWLRGHAQRVSDEILREVVFKHPLFLGSVCGYVKSRAEKFGTWEDPWVTLHALTAMGRQSPWAKLWLLDAVGEITARVAFSGSYEPVMAWVSRQLEDRHETVRAQAAWAAACHSRLSEQSLTSLYARATPISQAALAACMAKQDDGISGAIVNALKQDGPMMRKAYEWAKQGEGSAT